MMFVDKNFMKKRNILNILLILIVVCIATVFAFSVRIGAAADSVVVLKTLGMTCGSCAARIAKAMGSEKGVASTEVDLDNGRVIVWYESKTTRPEKLAERITGIGYGSSILQIFTAEEYRRLTGKTGGVKAAGGGCCGKGDAGCGGGKD